jgi:hypothetical protein
VMDACHPEVATCVRAERARGDRRGGCYRWLV